jgi:hypothetical protein
MSQQLTLELSDEVYSALQAKASAEGLSLATWMVALLSNQTHDASYRFQSADQKEEARQEFMRYAGTLSLGYATGADNECID